MGTRGAVGFRVNGTDKVQYNHYDSYPDGLGRDVINFVRSHEDSRIAKAAETITLIDGETPPTPEEIEQYREFCNLSVSEQSETDWYCLLRDAQGDLNVYATRGVRHMVDASSFLLDSLFCEWAYIVNVDEGVLEVYKGFNKEPGTGRYGSILDVKDHRMATTQYYGVTLLATFSFDDLRRMSADEISVLVQGIDLLAYPEELEEWEPEDLEVLMQSARTLPQDTRKALGWV